MRWSILFSGALVGSLLACKSQTVIGASVCSDPCCGGNAAMIDCGETRDIACVESGDPCMAQAFGCTAGLFFRMPQATLPASCGGGDGGTDATVATIDAATGQFGMMSGADAMAVGGLDAAPAGGPDAAGDGGLDATADASDAGAVFACGDASCAVASQYCRLTGVDAGPGAEDLACGPLDQGQSICAPDGASSACGCSQDAGGLYVRCDLP
jgi:hypothetical protein